ncbi:MAG: proliferating cell nuclear antigen (pcna) [Candidatus Aenigmatarchaeota archaeon]|nr:proliferating cell nuclear antigen (pcna) [Candidatus Aenigmarchaeota archaeon]
MFTATLSDTKMFKDCVDCIASLIDEGLFRLTPTGIELMAADRAMVAVIEFKINKEAFESYQCDALANAGLNMMNFLTVLKRAGPGDKLTLKLGNNRLEVILEGNSRRVFELPLLDVNIEDIPPINNLNWTANAELATEVLSQGIDDADIVSDAVAFELSNDGFRMVAEGDSSKAELKLATGSPALTKLDVKTPAKAKYPLDYLKKISKAARIADTGVLSISTDYPMRLEFKGANASIAMILAPRVSED